MSIKWQNIHRKWCLPLSYFIYIISKMNTKNGDCCTVEQHKLQIAYSSMRYRPYLLTSQNYGKTTYLTPYRTSFRWYHARRANAPKQDLSGQRFKVFWMFCSALLSRLYEVPWNYKMLLNMKCMLFSMVPFIF